MRIKSIEKIFLVFWFLVLILNFTPYMTYKVPPILRGVTFLALIVVAIFLNFYKGAIIKIPKMFPWFMLLIAQLLIYRVLNISTCSYPQILNGIMEYSVLLIAYKFMVLSDKAKKIAINGLLLVFGINLIDNIRLNVIYPNASEYINFEWGTKFYEMNVGGTVFSVLSVFIALFCFAKILMGNKKLFWAGYYILCAIYILITSRAISIISLIVGTGMLLIIALLWKLNKRDKIILSALIFFVAVVVVFGVLPGLLEYLAEKVEIDRLGSRLEELAKMLRFNQGSISEGNTSGSVRLRLYVLSIQTAFSSLKNFIFGVGEHSSIVELLNSMGIGAHSAILDRFAEYGVIGIICIYKIFASTYKRCYKKEVRTRNTDFTKCIFGLFVINALINNVFSITILTVIFILIPNVKENKVANKASSV